MNWYAPFLLVIWMATQTETAKKNCPDNLSLNCYCTGDQAVKCNFGTDIQDTNIDIFNRSQAVETSFNLMKLDISNNNLSTLPQNFLDGINILEELDLSQNNFQAVPNILQSVSATGIKKLDISHNKISDIGTSTFATMTKLEALDLSNNNLQQFPKNILSNNKYLWQLNLSDNYIQTLSAMMFTGLEHSIREMDISRNQLSDLDKDTFANLHDLKIIRLSGNNDIEKISDIDFPHHIILLDLSQNKINEIDECRFSNLIDLEYLNLHGNPLSCSCHLVWLHQRMVHNQKMDSIHHLSSSNYNIWTCINADGATINVTDVVDDCKSHYFLNTPEHCVTVKANTFPETKQWKDILNLKTEKEDEGVLLTWDRYNSTTTDFYGYEITIISEEGESIYNSPTLHASVTKYIASSSELNSGKYQVCLNILHNATEIIGKVCNEVSFVDLQIIIGILAGVIFLIPCVVALVYIMCLDKKKFMLHSVYSELSVSSEDKNTTETKTPKTNTPKENTAKWAKKCNKKQNVPTITVQDYTLTNTKSTDNILHPGSIPAVCSTDRILPDDQVSIEPDGDSGSSGGIRIDIPSDNDSGVTNEGFEESQDNVIDVKL